MNILLISANTEQINMPVLPLGMACVAEATRRAGHAVSMLNLMNGQDVQGRVAAALADSRPDVVGVSVRNIDDQVMDRPLFLLEKARQVIAAIRAGTDAPIALGGAGYSIFPQDALDYLGADMGIAGEGEAAFPLLLERLGKKAPMSDIPGLYLPQGEGGSHLPAPPDGRRTLDDFPQPDPALLPRPADAPEGAEIFMPFQTRRGCAMACAYCSTGVIEGRLLRMRSPAGAAAGLARFAAAGHDRFFFVDNTFNMPASYAAGLCDAIVDLGLSIRWRAIIYPLRLDDDLAGRMARAGCADVSLGFESGDPDILKNLNKRFAPADVRRVSEALNRHGIRQMGFLLLGGPGESRDSVARSLEFADSLNLASMKVTRGIRIYPGTRLEQIAREEGLIGPETDLLAPTFYMAPGLRDWLMAETDKWLAARENWMA